MRSTGIIERFVEAGVLGLLILSPLPYGSVQGWARAGIETVVALLVLGVAARMLLLREAAVPATPVLWPGLAMLAVVAAQLLRPGGTIGQESTWEALRLYLAYFAFALVLSIHITTRARVVRLVGILSAWGALQAIVGLVVFASGWRPPWFSAAFKDDRLVSTFVNPNHQAMYFSIVGLLGLGLLLRPRRRSRSVVPDAATRGVGRRLPHRAATAVLMAGALAVITIALVMTMSRGGLISTLAGLVVVVALALQGREGRVPVLVLGGATVGLLMYANWIGLERVSARFARLGSEAFTDWRWPVWESTLHLIRDAPLLGSGLGTYEDALGRHRPIAVPSDRLIDYAHNDYLQVLAETGLVGFAVVVWAMVAVTAFTVRRWVGRHDPVIRGLTLGGLGALVAVASHSATDFGLHMPANALLAATLAALLPAVVTLRSRAGQSDEVGLPVWRRPLSRHARLAGAVALVVVAGASLASTVPALAAGWYLARAADAAGGTTWSLGALTMGDLVRAREDLARAARLDEGNPEVQAARAFASEELAFRVWRSGVGLDGRQLGDRSVPARVQAAAEILDDALEGYEAALRSRPRWAYLRDRYGWFLAALEPLRVAVQTSQGIVVDGSRLARLLTGDESLLPAALHQLEQAVRDDPRNAQRQRSFGLLALAAGRDSPPRTMAAAALREALNLDPGLFWRILDDLMARRADERLVRAVIPPRSDVLLRLAEHWRERGRLTAARAAYEDAIAKAGSDGATVTARLAYAQALLDWGDASGALAQARWALVTAPQSPEVFGVLGRAYEAGRDIGSADSALASAVMLAEDRDLAAAASYRADHARFLARHGRLDRAIAAWRRVVGEVPNDPWARLELGRLLAGHGDTGGALREYQAAQLLGARDADFQAELAEALVDAGFLREAVGVYETAIRLRPGHPDLRVHLAELYRRIGWRDEATEQYRRVLEGDPTHEAARRGLADSAPGRDGATRR